ncbi:aurora kinase A and ninein-interacting protein [Calypte anna]|uniref:aurora kinase A and ninein-interacting protein n=1 Tax=Calypte anna TaxID=9244 RepID=UPI0011C43B4F|nr:aurora kinase A and ninein-interacting protein [Calypte anna]
MKRRRRGGAAQQPEACDVWLDTAQLKQSPAQPLIAKPKVPSQVLEWRQASGLFTQPRASQPRTKQTTISAFFSMQPDEKDKENSKPPPVILNKDCKGKGVSLDASPVKILALPQGEAQKGSVGAEEQVPAQRCARRAPRAPLGAESQERNSASCRMGEDSCSFSFTQDSAGHRVIAHRSARNQEEKPHPWSGVNSLIDFAAPEDINPAAVSRDLPWPPGFSSSPQGPTGAEPLREHNWKAASGGQGCGSPCRQLFTQDSEGNRVIAHPCHSLPSPGKAWSSSSQQPPRSHTLGCSRSLGKAGEQEAEVGYEFLFTQDSEGNRVIKHW